ncbi:hypothetical protein ACNJX9_13180 [Bradyrhizobium sp. DASA03076]
MIASLDKAAKLQTGAPNMTPIAPTVFWGPMAVAIMGGLLVATS